MLTNILANNKILKGFFLFAVNTEIEKAPTRPFLSKGQLHLGRDARKPVFGVCEQKMHRPACASTQTDQRLCYLLFWKVLYINLYQVKFLFSS